MSDTALRERREYRVVWKRENLRQKHKLYATEKASRRFLLLLGDEPWKVTHPGKSPDEPSCCDGYMCGCEGKTIRERHDEVRVNMPKLEWVRLEGREVGTWEPVAPGERSAAK